LVFHIYQKPKNQYVAIKEGDFKFHYETLKQIKKEEDARYIAALDAWHELDDVLKVEIEQDFDKIFNANGLILN